MLAVGEGNARSLYTEIIFSKENHFIKIIYPRNSFKSPGLFYFKETVK